MSDDDKTLVMTTFGDAPSLAGDHYVGIQTHRRVLERLASLEAENKRLRAVVEAAKALYQEGMCCNCTAKSKAWFRQIDALAALDASGDGT